MIVGGEVALCSYKWLLEKLLVSSVRGEEQNYSWKWKVLDFCSELTLKIKLSEPANGVSVFLCPTISLEDGYML